MSGKKWSRSRKRAFARRIRQLWQSPAYQQKMARRPASHKGGAKLGHEVTARTRARISVALTGRPNPGQSRRAKRMWRDPVYREHMSAVHRGQPAGPHWAAIIKRQHGPQHPRWKGGTIKDGYRLLCIDGKQVREHRVVMERMLGRKLKRTEVVHHKNGNRADNRESNLELERSQSEHNKKLARYLCPWCGSITTRKPTHWPRGKKGRGRRVAI